MTTYLLLFYPFSSYSAYIMSSSAPIPDLASPALELNGGKLTHPLLQSQLIKRSREHARKSGNAQCSSCIGALQTKRSIKRSASPLITSRGKADISVVVKFKSIGSAPIMKTTVFKVTASNRFQAVIVFLRGQLGFKATDPLVSCHTRMEWKSKADGSLHISMAHLLLLLMILSGIYSRYVKSCSPFVLRSADV
jgi:ubiquitin-like protein ATG12